MSSLRVTAPKFRPGGQKPGGMRAFTHWPARHPLASRSWSVTLRYSGASAGESAFPSSARPVREPCSTTGLGSKTSAGVVASLTRLRSRTSAPLRASTSTSKSASGRAEGRTTRQAIRRRSGRITRPARAGARSACTCANERARRIAAVFEMRAGAGRATGPQVWSTSSGSPSTPRLSVASDPRTGMPPTRCCTWTKVVPRLRRSAV